MSRLVSVTLELSPCLSSPAYVFFFLIANYSMNNYLITQFLLSALFSILSLIAQERFKVK